MKSNGSIRICVILLLIIAFSLIFVQNISAQVFNFQWGTAGPGQGQFNQPVGIAFDTLGNVFVADAGNNRVQKFDVNGTYLTSWGTGGVCQGIGIDSENNVYVADWFNNNVNKYNSDGVFVTSWGSTGNANGQFQNPHGVAVDSLNNVYVTDWSNHRVQKFSNAGGFLTAWGSSGTANGQFSNPRAISIDSSDRVYVGDATNRIQIFDSTGTYLGTWSDPGRGDGQIIDSMGIGFDSSGNFYVSEFGNNRIQKWDSNGNYLTKWGIFGFSEGRFAWPYGVAVNSLGDVYVVDSRNNRIQVFTQPLTATFNASGTWNYSWTNKRVTDQNGYECTPAGNSTGSVVITQNNQYVSTTIEGTTYSGFVSGATYNLSAAGIFEGEIITEEFMVTLASATEGSENSYSAVSDNVGAYCLGDGVITMSQTGGGGNDEGGGGGGGGGGCFIGSLLP